MVDYYEDTKYNEVALYVLIPKISKMYLED